jgi:hypothetical protein
MIAIKINQIVGDWIRSTAERLTSANAAWPDSRLAAPMGRSSAALGLRSTICSPPKLSSRTPAIRIYVEMLGNSCGFLALASPEDIGALRNAQSRPRRRPRECSDHHQKTVRA